MQSIYKILGDFQPKELKLTQTEGKILAIKPKIQLLLNVLGKNGPSIFVKPTISVQELKNEISQKVGIPKDEILLSTQMKKLTIDDLNIQDYEVKKLSTIFVKLKCKPDSSNNQ